MKYLGRIYSVLWPAVFTTIIAGSVLAGITVVAQSSDEHWPPQFPREGATKLFENDHVIVWEQVGRPIQPFAHQHIRDILHFTVEPGRVEVSVPEGLSESDQSGVSFTQEIYSREGNSVSYSKAGLGPHIELAPDENNLPVSIFVEIKGTEPADCEMWSTACQ